MATTEAPPRNRDRIRAFLDTLPEDAPYFVTSFVTTAGGGTPNTGHIDPMDEAMMEIHEALEDETIAHVTILYLYDKVTP
jgi:hypothetical protein